MDFDQAFDRLLGNEGGFSNHPEDPGGPTMWGVTQVVAREAGYKGDMRDLPKDFAKAIYKAQYWSPCQCGEYDPAIAFQVFDAAVNHGNSQAIKFLQYAAMTTEDGLIGAKTITAVRSTPVNRVVLRYVAQRLRFYTSLKTFATFGRGWTNRAAHNLDLAAEDI